MAVKRSRTIVIVGGGFCGAVVAANLLRVGFVEDVHLVLIERLPAIGRGIAYATRGYPYLLNVPAGRMSATTGAPNEFLEFARTKFPDATSNDFLPRELYGEYLQDLLQRSQRDADTILEKWCAEVVAVRRFNDGPQLLIMTADGRSLVADDVVLAVGSPRSVDDRIATDLADHPAYVKDPWSGAICRAQDRSILLIGSSLTMADAVGAIESTARSPHFVVISRHGLLPTEQITSKPQVFGDAIELSLRLAAALSLRKLLRVVRRLADEAQRLGGDWREAITVVRDLAPSLWRALRPIDHARFLRHLQTYWNIHRHRLPNEVRVRIDELQSAGRLKVYAGRIRKIVSSGSRLEVQWQATDGGELRVSDFDRVVNCSGPSYRVDQTEERLWRVLLRTGLCVPDELAMGIRVNANSALIGADGNVTPNIYYVGALLRANDWETTAVPELRVYCERLAAHLATTRWRPSLGRVEPRKLRPAFD